MAKCRPIKRSCRTLILVNFGQTSAGKDTNMDGQEAIIIASVGGGTGIAMRVERD
jgi:hypothetical protein